MSAWTKWQERRPTDHKAQYRWRVSPRLILGLEMQPEWTEPLRLVGMGYAKDEWWPLFSDWDGYRRTVDPTLEWRPAEEGENDTVWHGLELDPCPWTGKAPTVVALGRWVAAPLYNLEWIGIRSRFVKSLGWTDAAKLVDAWNTRAIPASVAQEAMP